MLHPQAKDWVEGAPQSIYIYWESHLISILFMLISNHYINFLQFIESEWATGKISVNFI